MGPSFTGSSVRSRHLLAFILAIALPCALLVALSAQMLLQQRELAEKRAADERSQIAAHARAELLSHLNALKLDALTGRGTAAAGPDAPVVLVARVEEGRLILPWEDRTAPAPGSATAFADAMRRAGPDEQATGQARRAIAGYRQALSLSASPVERALARLALARALRRAGQLDAARQADFELLGVPVTVRDDQGIPIAFYAARRLLLDRSQQSSAQSALLSVLGESLSHGLLSPVALYMARDLAEALESRAAEADTRQAADVLKQGAERQATVAEQALALQRSFAAVGANVRSAPADPVWSLFGAPDNRWLVSTPWSPGVSAPAVVVVRLNALAAAVEGLPAVRQAGGRIVVASGAENVQLVGPHVPDLGVTFTGPARTVAREETLQRRFYAAALLLVLMIAVSSGYFFWYHVRRDLQVAELRSQFVASVSHELKTPLTSIRMYAETLLLGRAAAPDVRHEYLATIVNETERLSRLLNNVLDFSKIENGTKTYVKRPQPLHEVVRGAARVMEYPLQQLGFELRLEVDRLPDIAVDPDAVQQAVLNLLSNAVKYSGSCRAISLTLCASDGNAVIAVTDGGIGVPQADCGRIFEKFYRSPAAEHQEIPGTGLGLTIVEHVAAGHGGRVEVESRAGHGSTFSLIIPMGPTAAADAAGEPLHVRVL